MTIKQTSDKAAVVDTELKWIDAADVPAPKGAKLLVINRDLGVAHISSWSSHHGWTHWHPLPTFDD